MIAAADAFFGIFGFHRVTEQASYRKECPVNPPVHALTREQLIEEVTALRARLAALEAPKRKRPGKAPTLEACVSWACEKHPSVPRIRERAEAWWKRFNDQEWIDSQGAPVLNWKSKFNTWVQQGWLNNLALPAVQKRVLRPDEML